MSLAVLQNVKLDQLFQRQEQILERLVHLEKLILLQHISSHGKIGTQAWIMQTPDLEDFAKDVRKWFAEVEGLI